MNDKAKPIDFELMKQAGLGDIDLSKLLGVSKAAVNHWRTGKAAPHVLRVPKIVKLTSLVQLAVADGKLPVAISSPATRIEEVRKLLLTYAAK